MSGICKSYVGLSCADGSCPIAIAEEYAEYGIACMYEIKGCDDCPYYNHCEDCAFYGTDICLGERK